MTCFFLSAISLKRCERLVERVALDLEAELRQRVAQRVAARVLAEHDLVRLEPDLGRVHDLVGRALLEHAVLVDPGLVGEGVAPDDRLVGLHRVAGEARDHAARARQLAAVDLRVEAVDVAARAQQHHDLLERAVAGALADPVDGALDLARAGQHAGVGVRDREPEVVVAVDRQPHVAQAGDEPVELLEVADVLLRGRVADRVGDVDDVGALGDRDRADLGGELDVGAGRVHRRELDVVAVRLRQRHRGLGLALDVVSRRLELVLDVDVRGRDERVDPRARRVLDRAPGGVDVRLVGARQPADHRALDVAGDLLDRLEVAGRGDREARLDHVDAEPCELLGDLDLLLRVERDPGRLLAVAQRGVEDLDAILNAVLGNRLVADFAHGAVSFCLKLR